MGRSSKHRAELKANRLVAKQLYRNFIYKTQVRPRGFYESPSNEAIDRYLADPELIEWIVNLKRWKIDQVKGFLSNLGRFLKADKTQDVRLYNTLLDEVTIGMNTGTWVLWVLAYELLESLPLKHNFVVTMDDVAPDWTKSVFDFEDSRNLPVGML